MATQPQPAAKQPAFSFMGLVKKTGTMPKKAGNKLIDPLTAAKAAILKALETQQSYAQLLIDGKPLPKKGGDKSASTWFAKQNDGWWSNIRYGQVPIPIVDGQVDMLIGDKLEDVKAFYAAVAEAIGKGELDTQIAALQTKRQQTLKETKEAGKAAA